MFKPVTALAVVVAQLVERLLLTQEIRGLNPEIGEILSTKCTIEKKDGNKENGPSFLSLLLLQATQLRILFFDPSVLTPNNFR